MERLLLVLGTVPARITAGLACMAALAVLLAPGEGWTADWEKVVAFVAALGLWGLAEARSITPKHPHDVRLMQLIEETLGQNERASLRTVEMSEDFKWTDFPGLRAMAVWEGPDYAFLDAALQRQWKPTLAATQDFRRELARRSMPMAEGDGWYSIKSEAKREVWEADATFLNDASTTLTGKLDAFTVLARRRLSI